MNLFNDDANESALFCKTLIQKRKASSTINPKNPKQLKLNFSLKTSKDEESAGEEKSNCSEKIGPTSGYFPQKRTWNVCPLCMKSFKTDPSYSNHMKQCAKSHKMTTQQLLGALELQKEQMQQQRGLLSHLAPAAKKTPSKKKEDKEADTYDLALGLALSKSLGSQEPKPEGTWEAQKATLQQFGIKSSHSGEPLGRKKNQSRRKVVLRTRTAEDRQKILIEKLGVMLLDEEEGAESEKQKLTSNSSFHNDQLAGLVNVGQRLWNSGENDENIQWYVEGIKSRLLPREGSEKDDKKCVVSSGLEIEISKLRLPREELRDAWKKMINNPEFSDVTARTRDSRSFRLHSVVLFARFPQILKQDYESAFEKHNLSTILVFLEYLYCGTLDSLVREEVRNLHQLASELKYAELIEILNRLENILSEKSDSVNGEAEEKDSGKAVDENKSPELFERDLFAEENVVDLTQSSNGSIPRENGNASDTETIFDEPFASLLQREKDLEELEELKEETPKSAGSTGEALQNGTEEEGADPNKDHSPGRGRRGEIRVESDDSATKDLTEEFEMKNRRRSNDSIILSSGSESRARQRRKTSPDNPSRTFSPVDTYEVAPFDPYYDDFHCFSEEQYSPPGVQSQSLIAGVVPPPGEPPRSPPNAVAETPEESSGIPRSSEYCSTPVTIRPSFGIKSSAKSKLERSRRRRRSDASASRILRKSLGLELKMKNKRSSAFQRKSAKRKEDEKGKDFVELLTESILSELSKSAMLKSSTPVTMRNFVEVSPVLEGEEFRESVTPLPNYSNMEENLLKDQLAKYGLKKNLAKSKAKKILRHIYEELHPLYNAETGKIVKILRGDTPDGRKKTKSRGKPGKKAKPKQNADSKSKQNKDKDLNSSADLSDGGNETPEGSATDHDTTGSDFENLSETLTQSAPSNPVDLPSAFVEFLDRNPEYHLKILSYEPIWLEDLQKKLKENFKKHFKMSDLMDYLDQKCITFRSATQVKKTKKQLEKRKLGGKKVPS